MKFKPGQFVKIIGPDQTDKRYKDHFKQIEIQKQPGWKAPDGSYPLAINHDHKTCVGKRGVIVWVFENSVCRVRIFNDQYEEDSGRFGGREHDFDNPKSELLPIEADDLQQALAVLVKEYVKKKRMHKDRLKRDKENALSDVADVAKEFKISKKKAEKIYRRFVDDGALDCDVDADDDYPDIDPELIRETLAGTLKKGEE